MIVSISPSTLNLFSSCARKYKFEKVDNWTLATKSVNLEEGELFHVLLEKFYQGKIDSRKDNILSSIEEAKAYAASQSLPVNEIEFLIKVFKEYAIHYATETWIPLAVEKPFNVYLGTVDGWEFYLEGKIDLIIKQNGVVTLVDHKTTSRFRDPHSLNQQFMAYAWALEQSLLIVNTIGLQESYSGAQRFRRAILNFDESVLEEWKEAALWTCGLMKLGLEKGVFPPNYTSCDKYSGCQFRGVCEKRPDSREMILKKDFVKGTNYDIFAHTQTATSNK